MSRPGAGNAPVNARNNALHRNHNAAKEHGPRSSVSSQASPRINSASASGGNTIAAAALPSQGSVENTALIKELKGLIGQPVRLTLDEGREEIGLLWSFDSGMGIVALEVPRSAAAVVQKQQEAEGAASTATNVPTTAAAFPSAKLSSIKVAAQGGDASGGRTTFTVINLRRIQRARRLRNVPSNANSSAPASTSDALDQALEATKVTPVTQDVNLGAAEARERAATSEAMKRAAKIGVGVSTMAQSVFDALNKTLPCRWADRHIVVMDEFVISPDKYDTVSVPNVPLATLKAIARGDKVDGVPDTIGAQVTRWQRVTKVLEGERKKLAVPLTMLATNSTTTTTATAKA